MIPLLFFEDKQYYAEATVINYGSDAHSTL